ncbi:MAG TPA: bifunctional phosphopantothenoylcysteine decarboxylase/phosphopantothenate--cysteine ligase CoaBC [Acidobacteriota bacterium]|jgi:phosphopantothenoylcysteine decarboxylase/phosphopantothenate--cysteine ligase|nr:bifunctional phosphopantothenoylcysteine decarboxylase/phosphopantothenate--cysteine ligase CoaBC [Acidobacteriota bacterium]
MANILLGVTGCIAAYKAAMILRELQKREHQVQVVMTRNAAKFVGPITFEALSGKSVWMEMFGHPTTGGIEHINVARETDLFLVAPATANTVAKFAQGIADDFLTTVQLSVTCPVVVAPAMNVEMWRHPAMQENLAKLKQRGVRIVYPESGYLACGVVGEGRLAEVDAIVREVESVLARSLSLAGKTIVVTSGPTCEDIDPVRFLTNRSTGKMGYALARRALARGASVVLISGPTHLEPPSGAEFVAVRTAREMQQQIHLHFKDADALVMAAAVSDYSIQPSAKKIKRKDSLTLHLEPTEDILAGLQRRADQIIVGFAAESDSLEQNAEKKLKAKRLDLMVANDITSSDSGFASDYNRVLLLGADGSREQLDRMPKAEVADRILDEVDKLLKKLSHHRVTS